MCFKRVEERNSAIMPKLGIGPKVVIGKVGIGADITNGRSGVAENDTEHVLKR